MGYLQMEVQVWVLSIVQVIPWLLFIWSEYLGGTPAHKSNAVLDLLICGLQKAKSVYTPSVP